MELQKLNVKFFIEQPNAVALTDFIAIFHSWIQASDGVYHDVADYSHMQAGPGIVLVANHANVSIDESGNRRGLIFSQKALLGGSNQEKIRAVLRAALENCRKLEAEPALKGKLRFAANQALLSVNDRLVGDNAPQAFDALKGDVEAVARELFGGAAVIVEREPDSRRPLSFYVRSSVAIVGLAQPSTTLTGAGATVAP